MRLLFLFVGVPVVYWAWRTFNAPRMTPQARALAHRYRNVVVLDEQAVRRFRNR